MDPVTTVAELVQRNKTYAATHKPLPTMKEAPTQGKPPPKVLIITCADPRCVPDQFLQLKPIETVVFRNPCGHVKPEMAALLALDVLVEQFEEIMIIHHTDCGATMYTDSMVKESIRARVPANLYEEVGKYDFHGITDLAQSVRDDINELKNHPLVPAKLKENAHGYIFDIKTGLITPVDV